MSEAVTVGGRIRQALAAVPALRCTGAYALAEWCAVEAHSRCDAGESLAGCLSVTVPAGSRAFRAKFRGDVGSVGDLLLSGMQAQLWTVPTYCDGLRTHAKTRTIQGAKFYDLRLSAEFIGCKMKHAGGELLPVEFERLTDAERVRVPLVPAASVPWFGGAGQGRAAELAALDAVLIAFALQWRELAQSGGLPRKAIAAAIARHVRAPDAVFDCWLSGGLLKRSPDNRDAYRIGDDVTWGHLADATKRRVAYRAKMRPKRRAAVSAVA